MAFCYVFDILLTLIVWFCSWHCRFVSFSFFMHYLLISQISWLIVRFLFYTQNRISMTIIMLIKLLELILLLRFNLYLRVGRILNILNVWNQANFCRFFVINFALINLLNIDTNSALVGNRDFFLILLLNR